MNTGIILLFATIMLSFFPITQSIYINNEMAEIESHLRESVEENDSIFEVIKFGNDSGNLVMTPKRVRGFEAFKPDTSARVIRYEKVNNIMYRIETSDGHDILLQVNEQTLEKFMQLILKLLGVSFVMLLIIDVIAVYFIMKSIVQPLQKIEGKINQLVQFDFGKRVAIQGADEFAVVAQRLNDLDFTLSQFIESRQAFATSLAHELKTPVAVIQSTVDLYQHQIAEYADYEYSKQLIERNLDRISETAKLSLQVFTRRSLFAMKEHDITHIVQTCMKQWESMVAKRDLKIESNVSPLWWEVDEDSFLLILSTIFQNMSRYAKQGTTLHVEVSDKIIFKNQIESNTTSGTQLGLEIAKTLASHSNLDLSHRYQQDFFIVEIKKKAEPR